MIFSSHKKKIGINYAGNNDSPVNLTRISVHDSQKEKFHIITTNGTQNAFRVPI